MTSKTKITLFNAEGTSKVPLSKYEDDSFIFVTKECSNLKEAYLYMINQYSLSTPLDIREPLRVRRKKEYLEDYKMFRVPNIAIDLDEIANRQDYLDVIEYFREHNYSCILGKSRSWDGKECFNIKGILKVNLKPDYIKSLLSSMQADLGDKTKVDLTVGNMVSCQSPTLNDFIIYYKENGRVLKDSDVQIEEVHNLEKITYLHNYESQVINKCLEIFTELGYSNMSDMNDSGAVNFSHFSEKKSKGSYFWFSSSPLIMHHPNKDKTQNIFHLIKDTEEGREWLKNKTKIDQENQLIKPLSTINLNTLYVNERYLDFSKPDKHQMILDFLDTEKGVFKIKSAMGTAKSSGIDLCIKEAHARNLKVILVSNRVSVAEDFADKYNIQIYKDPSSIKSTDSLVVQYDSLHKYTLSNYDIVIFDEYISLLLHHRANLTDNANINAVKFKILMENKRVLIADAFLTGYEDNFFKGRESFSIINEYKDETDLYEYTNKEYFISCIIDKATELEESEHLSCSFTSLNVMRVVHNELREKGIKVISLSSETSQITRDIIYKNFQNESHNAFQVILFTPTLTVGVSNLNNIKAHFHYDSGMSTDVISSLQMIKRSRSTKEVHYFLEERQYYHDTDIKSINSSAQKNINSYYNKKDKTLLIDVDYETGELKLTELARYINSIEVFYNTLANNHANAFKLLLRYQFSNKAEIIDCVDSSYTLRAKIKEVKDKIKDETLKVIQEHSSTTWTEPELDQIKAKISDKSDEEKAKLLMGTVQSKFRKEIPRSELLELVKLEIETDFSFVTKVKSIHSVINRKDEYTRYRLSKAISEDIQSLQSKYIIQFLEYMLALGDIEIKNSYSRNEIKEIDTQQGSKQFEKFLKRIGYDWGEARLRINPKVIEYTKYV